MAMMLLRRANVDQATGFSELAGEWSGAGHRSVKGQIVKEAKGQLSPCCKSLSGIKAEQPTYVQQCTQVSWAVLRATCYVW
jgi:hypothetical protein